MRASSFFGSSFLFHPLKRRPEIHLLFAGYGFVIGVCESRNRSFRVLQVLKSLKGAVSFFLCWVGYAQEGCAFFTEQSGLFHTERSWHTYRFPVAFVSGRQDLPSEDSMSIRPS